ncbi:MAG: hypothetical protein EPO68_02520, partial [Planctomycetota bacterium]
MRGALLSLLLAAPLAAQLPSSPGYSVIDWQLASAGGPLASNGFASHAALLWTGGQLASANHTVEIGFLAAHDPQPTNAPVIFAIAPGFGTKDGGAPVALSGINFDKLGSGASFALSIGGASATSVSVVSNTQATATTPAGAMGPADVVASTTFGAGTLAGGYVYTPAVVASPTAVPGGSLTVKNYGPLGGLFELWWSPVTTFIPFPPYGTILIGPSPATKLSARPVVLHRQRAAGHRGRRRDDGRRVDVAAGER